MFLTRGPMHHERTWRVWLEAAAGLLPRQAVLTAQEAACGDQTWAQMMAACAPSALSRHQVLGPSETAPVQHLFNIYVHALPNFTGGCWAAAGLLLSYGHGLPVACCFHACPAGYEQQRV